MAKQYISFQGKLYLAPIVAGVAGAARHVGNAPDFEIELDGDVIEHQESTSGQRTTDFMMTRTRSVNFKGTLEEASKENIAYILNGHATAIADGPVTGKSLGTVAVGVEVPLGGYNVSNVVITDSTPVVVDPSKYKVDAAFGTVTLNDVAGLTMPLTADFTAGAASVTTINDRDSAEYELTFRGINTVDNSKVEVKLWRTKKDASATFPLIHEELGSYEISGMALSDAEKGSDSSLGLFGRVVQIAAPV